MKKAFLGILFTLDGRQICFKEEQPANVSLLPNENMPS